MISADLEAKIGNRLRRVSEMKMAGAVLGMGVLFTITGDLFQPGQALALLGHYLPAAIWALIFVVLGTARLVALIVNGYWPLGPVVRLRLSMATMVLVWVPMTAGYWMMLPLTKGYPALILVPIALLGEANCLFALSALRAGRRGGQ